MATTTARKVSPAKIVIDPVDHYVGPRWTRRTWTASVVRISDDKVLAECGHHGHHTVQSATACGKRLHRATDVPAAQKPLRVARWRVLRVGS